MKSKEQWLGVGKSSEVPEAIGPTGSQEFVRTILIKQLISSGGAVVHVTNLGDGGRYIAVCSRSQEGVMARWHYTHTHIPPSLYRIVWTFISWRDSGRQAFNRFSRDCSRAFHLQPTHRGLLIRDAALVGLVFDFDLSWLIRRAWD